MSWQALWDWLRRSRPGLDMTGDGATAEVRHCGDPAAEYGALTQRAALLVSPTLAPFLIEGADAVSYLHRRLSQTIIQLALGMGTRALQLGGDGCMQADLLLWRGEDALLALAERSEAEVARAMIDKYTLMDDVTTLDLAPVEGVLGLAGPGARALLENLIDGKAAREALRRGPWTAMLSATLGGLPCRVFGDGRWGLPFYHIAAPLTALPGVAASLAEVCRREGGGPCGSLALEGLRLERGLTRHGLDTNEKTNPLEAGLQAALDRDKGCYPGQEIVARITNLGHPARALVRLELEGEREPARGAKLMIEGHESGWLTSAATWPGRGRTAALGYLQWADRAAPECDVECASGAIRAHVQSDVPGAEGVKRS